MLIQIQERDYNKSLDKFQVDITFNNSSSFSVELQNPFEEKTEKSFEWYFENYIIEPYSAQSKVNKIRKDIFDYGQRLFCQLFANREIYRQYMKGIDNNPKGVENLTFEITGNSPEFQAIHWETLSDSNYDRPLSLQGAIFYRKIQNHISIEAKVEAFPYINLLIVTARPGEDEDVHYRTIQRPLLELINKSGVRVKPHILRPGTFKALVHHLDQVGAGFYHIIHFDLHGAILSYDELNEGREKNRVNFDQFDFEANDFQIRWGLYDLKRYEGKRAFLFFESEDKGVAIPVEALELANSLRIKRIPLAILNACQSAKQESSNDETSLGKILAESGMQLVLAMRYSISVSAAVVFMQKFYEQILKNISPEVAIAFARRELYYNKNRSANFGQTIELEDWLLPVVYQNCAVVLNLRDFEDDREEKIYYLQKDRKYKSKPIQYGFFGRDLDILKIEKMLLRHNHLLLQGLGGVGKSTLLDYLAEWWSITDFVKNTFYFGYDQHAWTLEQILFEIARKILIEPELNRFHNKTFIVQKNKILEKLKAKEYCIILDNIESITRKKLSIPNTLSENERGKLKTFLSDIKKSVVIYGSRCDEDWLKNSTYQNNIYTLNGFDDETTYLFAKRIITQIELDFNEIAKEFNFRQLINLLAGFPLPLKTILPILKKKTPKKILKEFQTGINLQYNDTEDKTQNIVKCIEYSYSNLSEDYQKFFLLFSPFQSTINFFCIERYLLKLKDFERFKNYSFYSMNSFVDEAVKNGFLQQIAPDFYPKMMKLHPLLSYFLKSKSHKIYDATLIDDLDNAFINYYIDVGNVLNQLISSQNAEERELGVFLIQLEYENLYNALKESLNRKQSIGNLFNVLDDFLELKNNNPDRLIVAQMIKGEMEKNYPPEKITNELGNEFFNVLNRIGLIFLNKNQYLNAKTAFLKALEFYKNYKGAIKCNFGIVYGNMGIVSGHLEKYEESEVYHQKALEVFIQLDDKKSQAMTYQNLGLLSNGTNKHRESKKYFHEALEIYNSLGDSYRQAKIYSNLGIYSEMNESIEHFKKARDIYIQFGDKKSQADVYQNMAVKFLEVDNYEASREYLKRALEIYLILKDKYQQAQVYENLGIVSRLLKNYLESKDFFKKALVIHTEHKDKQNINFVLDKAKVLAEESENNALLEELVIMAKNSGLEL